MGTESESAEGKVSGLFPEQQDSQGGGIARWKIALAVLAAVVVVVIVVAAARQGTPQYGGTDAPVPSPPTGFSVPAVPVVVATVNGEDITTTDLARTLQGIPERQRAGFQANPLDLLDAVIMRRLILQERKRQPAVVGGGAASAAGAPAPAAPADEAAAVNEFVARQVYSKVHVTDEEVRAFYDAHKEEMKGSSAAGQAVEPPSFEKIKEPLTAFITDEKRKLALAAYLDGLRKNATITFDEAWVAAQKARTAEAR